MKKPIILSPDQLRRIICSLRRKLSDLRPTKTTLLHDPSDYTFNVGSLDVSAGGNFKVLSHDPRRIAVFLSSWNTTNTWAAPVNCDVFLPGNIQQGLFRIDGTTFALYSYQAPVMVSSEWWVSVGAAASGRVAWGEEVQVH